MQCVRAGLRRYLPNHGSCFVNLSIGNLFSSDKWRFFIIIKMGSTATSWLLAFLVHLSFNLQFLYRGVQCPTKPLSPPASTFSIMNQVKILTLRKPSIMSSNAVFSVPFSSSSLAPQQWSLMYVLYHLPHQSLVTSCSIDIQFHLGLHLPSNHWKRHRHSRGSAAVARICLLPYFCASLPLFRGLLPHITFRVVFSCSLEDWQICMDEKRRS